MYYFKNSLDIAKQKAGQLGKMAKDFASDIIVTENLPNDPSTNLRSQKQKEMLPYNTSVKHDFIEDLNQSPREQIFIPNPEMINPNTVSNQNKYFSNNILEKNTNELNSMKNKQDIINFNPQEFENQKLQDVIKVLEQKIVDLQKQFQEIEVKSYEETPLILQIKEKHLEEAKIREKLAEILNQNLENFIKISFLHAIQKYQSLFSSYLESQNLEPELEILFLNILEEGDSKALLEDLPNFQESPIGLDIEKMKELFQKEEEYCSLKSTVSDYEKLLLEQNDKMNQASNENKRLSYELEKTNDEVCNLKTNLQSLLNSNIDFERENLELKAFLQEKSISLIGSLEKIKHYEDSLLKKNEDLAVTIEKSNSLEEENQKLKKQIEELYNENEDLKEKAFRNQIQQEQNEEIFKNFKFVLMKSAKELVKGFEEIDIREEIKRLEATETSSCDFSGFLNETENFEAETNHKVLESHRRELENFKKLEKEKSDILMKNLSKIQSDCREMVKVDKDNKQTIDVMKKAFEKTAEEKDALQSAVSIKDLKIKEQTKIINDFQENKRSFVEELKHKSKEIDSLRSKIKVLEEEKDNLGKNLEKIGEENRVLEGYRVDIDEKNTEIKNLLNQIDENEKEISSLNNGLRNLQVVHEDTQQRNELLAKKYDNELKRLRNELEICNRKLETLTELQNNFIDLQKRHQEALLKMKDLERKYKESEQEKADIKIEANALIKKVKNETLYKDNMVDKRVVCKFLVNYFEPTTNYHVKLQILETLSSVLSFTNEERVKIGLHKNYLEKQLIKQGSNDTIGNENLKNKSIEEGETLKDKLMIYLMNEDDDEN